ncbi:MAG TPA: ABC transporter permease [Vicinamibacterales bacterium]|nr:ABC transporter permease [Vicinamibacterales bacterium]
MLNIRTLVIASLRHYRGIHALVVAGVAVAVAVLAGALLVGASVRESLRDLALSRLGSTDVVVSSTSDFRASLADEVRAPEIGAVAPVLAVVGAVMHEDSRRTAGKVQVFGIDDRFMVLHARPGEAPREREAWISPGLAAELGAGSGDGILLRIAKPTDIPLSHLQGRREDASRRVRLSVTRVADRSELGEFSLVPAQGPALSVFVSLSRLQQDLDSRGSANALLVRTAAPLGDPVGAVRRALVPAVQLEDLGLKVRANEATTASILESRTGLLPEAVWKPAADRAADRGGTPVGVLTHLANSIRANGREIPYSLISAVDLSPADAEDAPTSRLPADLPPIRLNEWAVEQLGVRPGDRIAVDYYLWSDQDGLLERSGFFAFAGTVPMSGLGGDASLTPEYPGITDAADVTSWDPPFPIDMQRVRKVDEDYWDRWGAAPKAFIPLRVGQSLWPSPFGTLSSLRTGFMSDWPPVGNIDAVLTVRDARGEAMAAADGTTDFGEYFVYFSFFLVVSGLLLAGMFFALSVEQRAKELGLLLAVGYRHRDIRGILVREAAVLAVLGSLIGMAGAVAYAALIMYGLRTWWVGAVNTTALELHVDPVWLLAGGAGALVSAVVALTLAMRRVSRSSPRSLLLGGLTGADAGSYRSDFAVAVRPGWHATVFPLPGSALALIAIGLAIVLIAIAATGAVPAVAAFFGAGGLLMIAGCAAFASWLRRPAARSSTRTTIPQFGAAYARWRPTRSVLSAALIAFACFVIVAVTAFRRDASGQSLDRDSGTGGFALMAESVVPLMHNPNTPAGRAELSLTGYDELDEARVTRFRLRPGDEASCLTLYKPTNPRLVAPEPAFIDANRFTFARSLAVTDEERVNPWLLLHRRFDDGAVPAIADQTSLTYVFHLAVGDDFVFTPDSGEPITLRIVGTLADSVLQSELIIGEHDFVRLFPMHEGYRVWLIETPDARARDVTTVLEDRLSDFGVDVTDTRARLAAYHQVENTYLSTFQALGALGLLLGTLGLAAVLARNVFERRRELGLLGAIGFTQAHMRTLVTAESLLLVGTGVVIGTAAALLSIAPAIAERGSSLPFASLGLLIIAVVATGVVASLVAVRMATSMNVVDAIKNE